MLVTKHGGTMKTTAFNSPEKRKLGGRERGREYTRRYSAIILRYRFPGLMRTRLAASRETVRSEAKGGWGEGGSHRMEKSRFHRSPRSLRSFPRDEDIRASTFSPFLRHTFNTILLYLATLLSDITDINCHAISF